MFLQSSSQSGWQMPCTLTAAFTGLLTAAHDHAPMVAVMSSPFLKHVMPSVSQCSGIGPFLAIQLCGQRNPK